MANILVTGASKGIGLATALELMNTQTRVLRRFRNDGMRDPFDLGRSVSDRRPAEKSDAQAREHRGFAE